MTRDDEPFLNELESGRLRVASRGDDGTWSVHVEVKERILDLFRHNDVIPHGVEVDVTGDGPSTFRDKRPFSVRRFTEGDAVRVVPGGSTIRRGAYVGRDVVFMPPMYVNVGAHIGDQSMIDSHALVGSCAQIGSKVHVSAAAQIGGVLEPPGARPVIIEDDAFIGGNTGLYEGVLVRARAVIASGVILTATTPIFDLVHQREIRGDRTSPLEVPEGAVVVPGTRPVNDDWGREQGLQVACAMIVKYRDQKTNQATALEQALRTQD